MLSHFLNPEFLIKTAGLVGVYFIVFAESGLFFGFFLPGDSLLFTAGFLASQGYLNVGLLVIGSAICAILGDSVGYAFGRKIGPKLFSREDSRFFHKKHLDRAKVFYENYGKKTIILARFVPIVRTFAPIVAGIGEMKYNVFLSYNIAGGIIWTFGNVLLGYWLGSIIPNADRYLLPIVIIIIFLSFVPVLLELAKKHKF